MLSPMAWSAIRSPFMTKVCGIPLTLRASRMTSASSGTVRTRAVTSVSNLGSACVPASTTTIGISPIPDCWSFNSRARLRHAVHPPLAMISSHGPGFGIGANAAATGSGRVEPFGRSDCGVKPKCEFVSRFTRRAVPAEISRLVTAAARARNAAVTAAVDRNKTYWLERSPRAGSLAPVQSINQGKAISATAPVTASPMSIEAIDGRLLDRSTTITR